MFERAGSGAVEAKCCGQLNILLKLLEITLNFLFHLEVE